jgi:cytochrome b561
MENDTQQQYSSFGKLLHWLTATLILAAFILGPEGHEHEAFSTADQLTKQWHETLGLAVFLLLFIRMFWRLVTQIPEPAKMDKWMARSATIVQGVLYAMMFALPVTAILGVWLEGHSIHLIGGAEIVPMIAKSHELGEAFSEVHEFLGDAIIWLAGLHAAAALFHHYLLQDNVLRSMLPNWAQK